MKVVYECPAYDIIDREVEVPTVKATGRYAVLGCGDDHILATAGSVVSYALENGQDPIALLDREREHGYPTHWMTVERLSLTSHKQARRQYEALHVGQTIKFEGLSFKLERTRNAVRLVAVAD
jgi:hypothetical protein